MFMPYLRCVNNFNDTFELHELILQCFKNDRELFQADRISICGMVGYQKVCRVTLTQNIFRDQKRSVCS